MRKILILLLYRILPAAAFPLLLLYVFQRCLRDPRYFRRIRERFGFLPATFQRTAPDSVWLHAVSVGEVLSSVALIERIRAAFPESSVFLSCSTVAGRDVADSRLASLVDGVFYAPIDYVSIVRRVLRRIRPAAVVVLETEIWPNLYREAKRAGCALVVVNGRISPKALPRYRRLAWFFRTVLALPDRILVQSESDRENYLQAGAPPDRVIAAGNLKFDFEPRAAEPPDLIRSWLESGAGPLWIAASTVAPEYPGDVDEDDVVIAAYAELRARFPGLRLLVAPRKPERFDAVADKMRAAGLSFLRRSVIRRGGEADVLLLDSVGELSSTFSYADVVFVGGTLADRGGHNVVEPAHFERAVVVGPHLENFAAIQRDFRARAAFAEIAHSGELAAAVARLLAAPEERAALGRRARAAAEAQRGATERAVDAIAAARGDCLPKSIPYGPLRPVLWALSLLWRGGGAWKRAWARPRRLRAPVVSVGGLSMGGAGKTPVVRRLARTLAEAGVEVAVLTRGYRRGSAHRVTVVPRGDSAPVELTGDEPQTLVRDGAAHLGIAADRFAAGRAIEDRFSPSVFLLDDGFQHASLARDLDIVLIDAADPLAGGVFPFGRLREPWSALRRASAVIVTRAGNRRLHALHAALRDANPEAPIFHADFVPSHWVDASSGERLPLDAISGEGAGAFCGLAQPDAFWRTLRSIGCRPEWTRAFPDHHRYTAADRADLTRTGNARLLTTEKDAVKLEGLPGLLWLAIDVRIRPEPGGPELLALLQPHVKVTKV